jgi:hypothetical protein
MIYLRNKDQQDASCWSLSRKFHEGTEVGSKSVPLLITLTLEGGGWSIPCPWPHYSQERYPWYRRLGGPQDQSGWMPKSRPIRV